MSLLDVTHEIEAALASLRKGQAFIVEEIARLEAFLAASSTMPAGRSDPSPGTRRGRPPKTSAASSSPTEGAAKRGPGRPRKSATAADADPAPAKRGPGRPKKVVADAQATAPSAKRGPGRPKKEDAAPPADGKKKPTWTPAAREAARKRMQDYWATRKKKG